MNKINQRWNDVLLSSNRKVNFRRRCFMMFIMILQCIVWCSVIVLKWTKKITFTFAVLLLLYYSLQTCYYYYIFYMMTSSCRPGFVEWGNSSTAYTIAPCAQLYFSYSSVLMDMTSCLSKRVSTCVCCGPSCFVVVIFNGIMTYIFNVSLKNEMYKFRTSAETDGNL